MVLLKMIINGSWLDLFFNHKLKLKEKKNPNFRKKFGILPDDVNGIISLFNP
jgi:hypothetical protein